MNKSPEEILNSQIWEILRKIREEYLVTEKLQHVRFRMPNVVGVGVIPRDRREAILRKLQEWAALKIKGQDAYGYLISINDKKFDEIYLKYQRLNEPEKELQGIPSHEYYLTNSDLIESLERKLSSFINLPEKGFFLGISDYIKFIDENSGFTEIITTIDGFREKDRTKLKDLEAKVQFDIDKAEEIILQKISINKIKSGEVERRLEDYKKVKDGRIQSSSSNVESIHDALCLVIMALYEDGRKPLISDFVKTSPDSNQIVDYKISESYYPYKAELKEFKLQLLRTVWGSWNELVLVYLVIHRYKDHLDELIKKNDVLGQMNFYMLHQEMENVLGNAHDEPRRLQFGKEDYLIHINRVHDFIVNKLKSNPNKNTELETKRQSLDERYSSLIKEIRAENVDLENRYEELLAQVNNQNKIFPAIKKLQYGEYKLEFSSGDGLAAYRGELYRFSGKARSLLEFMQKSKNTPFSVEDFKEKCNPNIDNPSRHFKGDKDTRDTINYIRSKLKVNDGEFFPIRKRDGMFIWLEK